ncbi:MAG: hydrogenase iron-sulfur subunit [Deltaproteobacteria bacterium]|nr:hydrogenase iron-sulfur subunit [Deltaproteobacteria bacterium]
MVDEKKLVLALFYCQNIPESGEQERKALEKQYGRSVRFFPVPCSGRVEPLHFLRALEEFADAAYLVTCPEGACRYFEGNRRARKRVERTRTIIAGIGLEEERIGIVVTSKEERKGLAALAQEIMQRIQALPLSPVFKQAANR